MKNLYIEHFSVLESSDESGFANTSTRNQLPQSMKIMHEIMYKLEVLYVLCVLLMGRQRNQVMLLSFFEILSKSYSLLKTKLILVLRTLLLFFKVLIFKPAHFILWDKIEML